MHVPFWSLKVRFYSFVEGDCCYEFKCNWQIRLVRVTDSVTMVTMKLPLTNGMTVF